MALTAGPPVGPANAAPKKVVAFVGAARRGYTYQATREFLDQLEAAGGAETEPVRLSDYHLEP
ncbi:MAG: hypothetical protein ACM3NQ_20385 [Bacteroidales bacterium]